MFKMIKNAFTSVKNSIAEANAAQEYANAYLSRVQSEINIILETKTGSFEDSAPFKLKRGERYIGSVSAVMGTYKNDGRVAAHGVTVRVPIMKGVSYKVGAGRVAASKSWVYDQPGTLHFTSDRIVFNGVNTNSSVNLTKVIDITLGDVTGSKITIDRDTGKDWSFKVDTIPEKKFATLFVCHKGAELE
jgi:hypothetical protein